MSRVSVGQSVRRHLPWLVAAVGSLVIACICYRIWDAPLGLPWSYSGDALTNGMAFKSVVEHGTIWDNHRLAAPFGQHYQDWPLTDLLPLGIAKSLSVFTSNWAALINAVYLLSFPAIGTSAWWVMRRLGMSPWVATTMAIIYALSPYHFARNVSHLFLAGYYGVPLGAWFALSILENESLFRARAGATNRFTRYASWYSLRTVLFAVIIVSSSIYYAAFTAVMLVSALLIALVRKEWQSIVSVGGVFAVMGVTFVLLAMPTFLYRAHNGPNVLGAKRSQGDTEVYGLKLAQMLTPVDGHRIQSLAKARANYIDNFPVPGEYLSTAIGAIASVGLIWLIAYALYRIATGRGLVTAGRHAHLAFLAVACFLAATVGGFATLVSLFVTSQVRGWNRMSVVIAFMSLAAIGLLIDRMITKWRTLAKPLLAVPLMVALIGVATYDQYSPAYAFPYAKITKDYNDDQEFFNRVEADMPIGALVFQLPRIVFPEPLAPTYVNMEPYDPMRPYLHTKDLKWSYAGIEGRTESDWQLRLDDNPPPVFIDDIVAAGFTGLYIDRYAYADRSAQFEQQVLNITAAPRIESRNGRMSFFDLRAYAAKLWAKEPARMQQLKSEVLFPVIAQITDRDYRRETDAEGTFAWAPEDATIPVVNASKSTLKTKVSFELKSGDGQQADFDITWPDGAKEKVTAGAQLRAVAHVFSAKAGRSDIVIDSNAHRVIAPSDKRVLNFRIFDEEVEPAP